jgi:hypothetical protein
MLVACRLAGLFAPEATDSELVGLTQSGAMTRRRKGLTFL